MMKILTSTVKAIKVSPLICTGRNQIKLLLCFLFFRQSANPFLIILKCTEASTLSLQLERVGKKPASCFLHSSRVLHARHESSGTTLRGATGWNCAWYFSRVQSHYPGNSTRVVFSRGPRRKRYWVILDTVLKSAVYLAKYRIKFHSRLHSEWNFCHESLHGNSTPGCPGTKNIARSADSTIYHNFSVVQFMSKSIALIN